MTHLPTARDRDPGGAGRGPWAVLAFVSILAALLLLDPARAGAPPQAWQALYELDVNGVKIDLPLELKATSALKGGLILAAVQVQGDLADLQRKTPRITYTTKVPELMDAEIRFRGRSIRPDPPGSVVEFDLTSPTLGRTSKACLKVTPVVGPKSVRLATQPACDPPQGFLAELSQALNLDLTSVNPVSIILSRVLAAQGGEFKFPPEWEKYDPTLKSAQFTSLPPDGRLGFRAAADFLIPPDQLFQFLKDLGKP